MRLLAAEVRAALGRSKVNGWQSLRSYAAPEWFRDAKFGIWAHWGPQAVPRHGDWYARELYHEGSDDYKDHLERYGHPSVHGYKDLIPLWKAEKWDGWLAIEGAGEIFTQQGRVVATPAGIFPVYPDERSL